MEYQAGFGIPQELYYHQQQSHSPALAYPAYQQDHSSVYFNNPYYQPYHQMMHQAPTGYSPLPSTNALDYQMTPALYVLNQQAKILEKSLLPGMLDQPVSKTDKRRKQRGPYKKKNSNGRSPPPSPSARSDGSSSVEERYGSSSQEGTLKRRISEDLSIEDGQGYKHFKRTSSLSPQTQQPTAKSSIFRSIDLMAQSSACKQF